MLLTRLVTTGFGLAALGWSVVALGAFQAAAPFDSMARQIAAGESFRDEVLAAAAARLDSLPPRLAPASLLRSAAVLQLRLVESALDRADPSALDARLAALREALAAALSASPADPFLWLTHYWLDNTQQGFAPAHLVSLVASYAYGPREGWIAVRRNRLALAVFTQLDGATQARVVDEFAGLVDARLIAAAAANLAGPGWPIRDRLVAGLAEVDPAVKQALVKALFNLGVDLAIPGVPERGERPWR